MDLSIQMTTSRHPPICTVFQHPPIPLRQFDWAAWFDGMEEWLTGAGPTELEAIKDLLEQFDDT